MYGYRFYINIFKDPTDKNRGDLAVQNKKYINAC